MLIYPMASSIRKLMGLNGQHNKTNPLGKLTNGRWNMDDYVNSAGLGFGTD